jgi:hypothetical protein
MTTGVVVCFRNRDPIRLRRLLQTLSAQTVLPSEVVVINFGDACPELEKIDGLGFKYVCRHFPQPELWSKGLALNQGAKLLTQSESIMLTDCDMLFESNFIETGHQFFEDFENIILSCQILDLPADALNDETNIVSEFEDLASQATLRNANEIGACQWLLKEKFFALNGHDEEYRMWGIEDGDLHRRAIWSGLQYFPLYPHTRFLHQWHVSFREILTTDAPGYELFREWRQRGLQRIEKRLEEWNKGAFSPADVNLNGWGHLPDSNV